MNAALLAPAVVAESFTAESFNGLALGTCALLTLVLAGLAERAGIGDGGEAVRLERKLQSRPVPPVGGAAILITYLACGGMQGLELGRPGATVALILVFAVGTLDDLLPYGLSPLVKLVMQGLALLPLWLATGGPSGAGVGFWLACLVALNVLNTFDNSDGAVGSLAALGFAFASPFGLAVMLGFLPFNCDSPRRGPRAPTLDRGEIASRTPSAYLGDAGAFVVALLLMLNPGAWAVLWIPALDLARLAWIRPRLGSRPWVGDRRHLAHRLQKRVPSRIGVALLLALMALPGALGARFEGEAPGALGWGLLVGTVLYLIALSLTRRGTDEPAEVKRADGSTRESGPAVLES